MYTLCIRYELDPNRTGDFVAYARSEQTVIQRCGGSIAGYWAPTDYAGPNNIAYGLINFSSLGDYETYRKNVAADPDHARYSKALETSGVIRSVERSFIALVDYDKVA